MKTALQAVRIGLGALAVTTGVAAQRAAPQLSMQSDLALAYQVRYCTNLSQTDRE